MTTENGQTAVGQGTATVTPPTLAGVHHISITVTDVEQSEAWYGRALGMHRAFVEPHNDSDAGGYAVVLAAGEGQPAFYLGLEHHPDRDGERFDERRTGLDHVCLQVPDRDALERWERHFGTQQVEHSGITEVKGMPFAVLNLRDPDGIALELIAQDPS